jgi:hypothetical protein
MARSQSLALVNSIFETPLSLPHISLRNSSGAFPATACIIFLVQLREYCEEENAVKFTAVSPFQAASDAGNPDANLERQDPTPSGHRRPRRLMGAIAAAAVALVGR